MLVAKLWCNHMLLGYNVVRSMVMRMLYNTAVILANTSNRKDFSAV